MDILQKMINEFAELYSESSAMRPISAYMGLSSEEYQLLIDNKVTICTPNERAFLDEIREKGEFSDRNNEYTGIAIGEYTFIKQSDFTRCNISELVGGKG